jgi:hypothetical protein
MTMRFRFNDLEGFHPDVKEAFAASPEALAQFVISEINYRVSELDEELALKHYDDEEVKDYLAWLTTNGAEGQFPMQILLSDSPTRRKEWAKRHIDAGSVAESILALPDAMLQEFHPIVEVWSEARQMGIPVDQVTVTCAACEEPLAAAGLPCPYCQAPPATDQRRRYPFCLRLTVEEAVVVNAMLAAISPALAVDRFGFAAYDKPPADVLTLTRLLFDRGTPLDVAYLPDRLEVFHKENPSLQEKAARICVQNAIPTAQTPNPLGDLLPAGSPTAFDLPQGKIFDNTTDIMSMLAKLTTSTAEMTMEEALAFEKAVNDFVGTKPDA